MLRRSLIGLGIGLLYAFVILAGYFVDRVIVSIFLCIVIALSVLEVRDALGTRIPRQFNVLVWIFALFFGLPYFMFGISGVAVFILAIFIVGCAISVFSRLNEAVVHLAYFSFLLIYPAFVMSAMFFINKSLNASGKLLDIHTVGLALVFLVASCTDMFAYFFGSLFGKHKLIPAISPKKTWEGAAGGLVGGLFGAALVYLLFETPFALFSPGLPLKTAVKIVVYIVIGIFGSAATQIGDLVASLVKRQCGIKDFSNLLGAHGGIMDRFDGMMFNAAFIAIIYAFLLA